MALGERMAQTGAGGTGRGPGEAPMTLEREATDLKTNNFEGASNSDMSRALPADIIGETEMQQDTVTTGSGGSRVGGALRSPGAGGARVWKERYLPDEQAVLENYFQ